MENILIIGVETVAGANLAACYSEQDHVVGVTSNKNITIQNCDIKCLSQPDEKTIKQLMEEIVPDRLILCGSMSESHWLNPDRFTPDLAELQSINTWAVAGKNAKCAVTLISSDAVFTGPWMFHSENSEEYCHSGKATFLRELESAISSSCPDALIIRTNIFGWSPTSQDITIDNIDSLCESLGLNQSVTNSYATPIEATKFVSILEAAHQNQLTGICHIAGSERTCQQSFMNDLAKEFGLSQPAIGIHDALQQRPESFTAGETSLHSVRVRKELQLPLPMLAESITQLHDLTTNGYADQFVRWEPRALQRAA